MGVEGIRIVTFWQKELIENGFPGVGIMKSHQQLGDGWASCSPLGSACGFEARPAQH